MANKLVAQHEYPFRKGTLRHRLSIAPVKSYYKNHTEHTINTASKTGFCLSYKAEYFLGEKFNMLFGMEFMHQKLTFQGYFEAPGNTYVYDETYSYSHLVAFQEINSPIGLKYSFLIEEDNYFSPYVMGGLAIRYIINSSNLIVNDSTDLAVHDGKGIVDFENNIGVMRYVPEMRSLNGAIFLGVGGQYNFRGSAKAIFLEMVYKNGLSRINYHGYNNSNDLFIKNSSLSFNFGVRF